ncbi:MULTISPECIES: type 1 glutamine amidotransferase domain-containing protein [unclassified Luteimonas]|uniref:type 1 glutamine amidotransferase domain-containing protein n=1 Tax=unclassified Luteimonas TaxID=2629088 RepID=UPI0018F06CCE|nr:MULTISPECIES: type 1 glutamine amidotransferase domain-containing protein [unclassified Luteimonas]MBJ6979415.1 type 1 glutamine amidotransferase [Luteimonas sp. MC1895]MBJ6984370.1 type 1 glutamine amidotransferase [Luteimonas sp. MC1750]QQO05010.1 type 1 glutamine amidotransferase [Luteimonas sp. MC1750]
MHKTLENRRVAILATDGFEQVELTEPRKAVEEAGAKVSLLSIKAGEIQGMHHDKPGDRLQVDGLVAEASIDDFDALILPGGVANPDTLRMDEAAVGFVRDFARSGKPIGVICHGPWVLIEADVVRGRRMTSWPSVRTDLRNAGAEVVDEEVVTDQGLVSSRKPDDLPAFCRKIVEEFAEGRHPPRS